MKKDRIKLDTPSIMFTSLTSKTWGRTFGFCAVLSNGEIEPERCEDYGGDYCTTTKVVIEPIDTDEFGLSAKQRKSMRGIG